jgi:hypothetical protein
MTVPLTLRVAIFYVVASVSAFGVSEPDFPMIQSAVPGNPLDSFRIDSTPVGIHGHELEHRNEEEWLWDPDDDTAYEKRLELARQAADVAEHNKTFHLFRAVIENDKERIRQILQKGIHPDTPLPPDPPREFLELLPTNRTVYYATKEQNFTPLMLAAALGHKEAAQILLQAGADRWQKTKRHKTYALWLASKTQDVELMRMLMNLDAEGQWERYRIRVDLAAQKMFVFEGNHIVMESTVSSGKKAKPTPPGDYVVTDKHREWTSSIYRVKMPHFVRLSCSEIGFHAGRLPGYPASSGCIRLPAEKARELFQLIPVGTLVQIE